MCRMIGLYATGDSIDVVDGLLESLVESSEGDHHLEEMGVEDPRHCHGWGYAAALSDGTVAYGRGDPLDCDGDLEGLSRAVSQVRDIVAGHERFFLLVHARRAGRGEPRGPQHAHPYSHTVALNDGPLGLFFAHNGSMKKGLLAQELSVDVDSYTDSHLALLWLASRVADGLDVGSGLRELALYYTRRAFDAILLEIGPDGEPGMHIVGYAPLNELDEARVGYYEPVLVEGKGIVGYISSTVRDRFGGRDGLKFTTIWGRMATIGTDGEAIIEGLDRSLEGPQTA